MEWVCVVLLQQKLTVLALIIIYCELLAFTSVNIVMVEEAEGSFDDAFNAFN